MNIFFEDLEQKIVLLFGKSSYRIDHPCVRTNNHAITIGHEYWLNERSTPVKKVIVKRVLLNINSIKLRVLEVKENRAYWIKQTFDEHYWRDYDWKLLDNSSLPNNSDEIETCISVLQS